MEPKVGMKASHPIMFLLNRVHVYFFVDSTFELAVYSVCRFHKRTPRVIELACDNVTRVWVGSFKYLNKQS